MLWLWRFFILHDSICLVSFSFSFHLLPIFFFWSSFLFFPHLIFFFAIGLILFFKLYFYSLLLSPCPESPHSSTLLNITSLYLSSLLHFFTSHHTSHPFTFLHFVSMPTIPFILSPHLFSFYLILIHIIAHHIASLLLLNTFKINKIIYKMGIKLKNKLNEKTLEGPRNRALPTSFKIIFIKITKWPFNSSSIYVVENWI